MRIAVVIATLGRPDEVGQLLERLAIQTLPPSTIILSVENDADLPPGLNSGIKIVMGPRGLPAQRNRGIDLTIQGDCDLIAFFDDDFLPGERALEGMAALFREHDDIIGATGLVLADGVTKGGIEYDRALALVTAFDQAPVFTPRIERDVRGVYGCNMVFRSVAIDDIRFDENLLLYGWQEDVDFGVRLLLRGRVVKTNAFAGVHRGVTRGRTSGVRFGFSQVVNPVYLVRKRTMGVGKAGTLIARNIVTNHLRMFWPEPWVDRWGRVRGNWIGLASLFKGPPDPRKVLDVQ